MPRFDLERFGILLQGSPRHADVLICTGPITHQIRDRIIRVYEQAPEPKFVVAVGSCGTSGRPFCGKGAYSVMEGVDSIIPVHMYVPGCPPRPDAITYAVLKLLSTLDPKLADVLAEFEKSIPGIETMVQEGEPVAG
jgi:Ni,Fe-hydrogenase III small subunit